ncbi:MAG: hypothetical protein RIT45_1825 [Pseudomonadota bacterium]
MLVIFDDARAWQVGQGGERALPLQPVEAKHVEHHKGRTETTTRSRDEAADAQETRRSEPTEPDSD